MLLYTIAAVTVPLFLVGVYYIWIRRVRQTLVDGLHKKCVFITGCDTGFGHVLARRLDSLGIPVFAGCLTESGAKNLKEAGSERLQTVIVDVGRHESIVEAYEFVKNNLPDDTVLWGVVNNAGIPGLNGPLDFMNMKAFRDNYQINFLGLVDVCQTFMPLINRSRGRIVNTSSASAILTLQAMYPYLTSKVAVRAFTTALRFEKKQYGVKVACVLPGFFATPISDLDKYERQIHNNWQSLPRDVQEYFGEEYNQKVIKNMRDATKSSADPDVTPVVDAYEHALLSHYPRNEYFPGLELVAFVLSMTPWYVNKYLCSFLTDKYLVVPRALQRRPVS